MTTVLPSAEEVDRQIESEFRQDVEDTLSEEILRGSYKDVDVIIVSCRKSEDEEDDESHLFFEGRKAEAGEKEELAKVTEST